MGNADSRPSDGGAAILSALLRENKSYAQGHALWGGPISPSLRGRLSREGQSPVAAIIACADSRVPPELLFRAKLGDLFVIRTAGNTPWGPEVAGSVEYAIDHLNVPLVIVLGHSGCGAVKAACAGGDPLPGMLGTHITAIAKKLHQHKGLHADPVQCNVIAGVDALRYGDSADCVRAAEKRGVVFVGAVYNMGTGLVSVVENGVSNAIKAMLPTDDVTKLVASQVI